MPMFDSQLPSPGVGPWKNLHYESRTMTKQIAVQAAWVDWAKPSASNSMTELCGGRHLFVEQCCCRGPVGADGSRRAPVPCICRRRRRLRLVPHVCRENRGRGGPGQHPGQQRRHHPRCKLQEAGQGQLGCSHPDQPRFGVVRNRLFLRYRDERNLAAFLAAQTDFERNGVARWMPRTLRPAEVEVARVRAASASVRETGGSSVPWDSCPYVRRIRYARNPHG